MMKRGGIVTLIWTSFLIFQTGCSKLGDEIELPEVVSYHDRNGDGKVDLERHRFPGAFDMDREFRDDNFDGKFESDWCRGVTLRKTPVNLPIPTNVVITPE